jgi:hypothetical protein
MEEKEEYSDEELIALADQILAGRDEIPLPLDLIEEPAHGPGAPKVLQKSLQARIVTMKVGEKLKLALKGHRDARAILLRDGTFIVKKFVMMNPRISEDEVTAIAKNRNVERELIDMIVRRKEWLANYQIRLALVTNPKTPVTIALKHLTTLMTRDLRQLAKSKNVPAAVNSAAKRMVIS